MGEVRLALVGFGNVGRALARLLARKADLLRRDYDLEFKITGIATRRHGMAIDPGGLDPLAAVAAVERGEALDALSKRPRPADILSFIREVPADALFENSPVNVVDGQPAIAHLQAALEAGMHAITANKGPVVHGYALLKELAARRGRRFLFESAVMDGAPIFSLFRGALPGAELRGFSGILNSCTNLLLERMDSGEDFDQAVRYAQSIGIAETDPSMDVDGWDASIKLAALATTLMGIPTRPQDVDRSGIRGVTPALLAEARAAGERWKLVCEARGADGRLTLARVAPQRVKPESPLYSVTGTSSYVQFETDVLPALGILEGNPSPETTAFGLLADLINALRGG